MGADCLPDRLWSPEKLAEMAGKTCDDCADHIARWGQDYPNLKGEALHIAVGAAMGGWACDHVDWDDDDAARAYEALWLERGRERERLRAEIAELRAELGRRDDALVQVARVVRAYEASIGEEAR